MLKLPAFDFHIEHLSDSQKSIVPDTLSRVGIDEIVAGNNSVLSLHLELPCFSSEEYGSRSLFIVTRA